MEKSVVAFAPGRVELLGNHTDYNEGLALAAAIDLGVTIRAEKLDADVIEVSSETNGREVSVSLKNLARLGEERWANYPIGVIKILREAGFEIGGLRLQVSSNLPPGSGLSSSAAFEVATAVAALELFDLSIDPMALAQLCQKAENEFVGVRCGLLDQASSVFGKEGEVILSGFSRDQCSNGAAVAWCCVACGGFGCSTSIDRRGVQRAPKSMSGRGCMRSA